MAQALPRPEDNDSLCAIREHSVKCTICTKEFANLQDCLKHELLDHTVSPKKTIGQKVNLRLSSYQNDVKMPHHIKISSELKECEPGRELNTIMKHSLLDHDNLSFVYAQIHENLKHELRCLNAVTIRPFGSFITGLAIQGSDIDIYIEFAPAEQSDKQNCSTKIAERKMYNLIDGILQQSSHFSKIFSIRHARVPIIKCKHLKTEFNVDINTSSPDSVQKTNFLRDLLKFDQRLRELMVFLKLWAKVMQLIGRGNMTSYFITMLTIFYLQQVQPNRAALVPSIEKLQKGIEPNIITGVNYAYNLQENMPIWPKELTTTELVKGFFRFYKDLEFERELLAPFLGKAIPRKLFNTDIFKFPAYQNQLRAIPILENKKMANIDVANCVCVQDIFCLTHNVGKAVKPANLEYFRRCIIYAYNFTNDPDIKTTAQLYHAWLYDIVPHIAQDFDANSSSSTT